MDRFQVIPAAYVVLRRGDEVLMLLRANTGYMDGYWAVPAGHVEKDESTARTLTVATPCAPVAGV